MVLTVEEQIFEAKQELKKLLNARILAHAEHQRISKLPTKKAGGGKGAKKAALQKLNFAIQAEKHAENTLQDLEKEMAEPAKVTGAELQDGPMENPEDRDSLAPTGGGASAGDTDNNIMAPPSLVTGGASASDADHIITPPCPVTEVDVQPIVEDSSPDPMKMKRDQLREKHLADDGLESMAASSVVTDGDTLIQSNPLASEDTKKTCDGQGTASKDDEDANDDKAEKKGTKRKSVTAKSKTDDEEVVRFDDLDEEEKERLREKGEKAIDLFLTKNKQIPFTICHLIREVQEFLPRAATTSRALSLHILDTNWNNGICPFHQRNQAFKQVDGFGQKYILVGVPYHKTVSTSKGEAKQSPKPGHLHCGCSIDVVLMDFFYWKTWALKSSKPGLEEVTEGLQDDILHSRHRAFIVQAFTEATKCSIDDLYAWQVGMSGYTKDVRLHQIAKLLEVVNQLNAADGSPLLTLVEMTRPEAQADSNK